MDTLYTFLKQKIKDKNLSVRDIAHECFISRATLYRIMKGKSKPSNDLRKLLEKSFHFSESEKHEFNYYITISEKFNDISESLEKLLYDFLFHNNPSRAESSELEFICYEGREKNIKNYQQILSQIKEVSARDGFRCEIHIVNCANINYIKPIADLLLLTEENHYSVEHLIKFTEDDYETSFEFLCGIIPLFAYNTYKSLFRNSEVSPSEPQLFSDIMLIKCSFKENEEETERFMVLSFREHEYSDCFILDFKAAYSFFYKHYSDLKKEYQDLYLILMRNIGIFSDFYSNKEAMYEQYLLKDNPCYNYIPLAVYDSLISRYPDEDMAAFCRYLDLPSHDRKTFLSAASSLYESIKKRIDYTYTKKKVNVYTKRGMEEFARTGLLSDHTPLLPAFTKDEVRTTLLYLKDRNNDENDSFELYIVNEDMTGNCVWLADQSGGLSCQYLYCNARGESSMCSFYITNSTLAKIFVSFIGKYIPENIAISREATNTFIDGLIKKYCET